MDEKQIAVASCCCATDFGPYRIMKRDIPTAYPVTAIETGYYKDGAWIWKHYFRPVR